MHYISPIDPKSNNQNFNAKTTTTTAPTNKSNTVDKEKSTANSSKATKQLNLNTNSPIKYIQRQFSPIIECASPIKFKNPDSNANTPSKMVYLTLTPNHKANQNPNLNPNNSDNSLDYSSEFRELVASNKTSKASTTTTTTNSPLKWQQQLQQQIQQKPLEFQKASKTSNNEIPSPIRRKPRVLSPNQDTNSTVTTIANASTRQPPPKKFKQLTVSQAFGNTATTQAANANANKSKVATSTDVAEKKQKQLPSELVSIMGIKSEPVVNNNVNNEFPSSLAVHEVSLKSPHKLNVLL